jgi:alkylhydroperoxidase/carboxymuconolactone decarboxylase family protein YurZ
MKNYWKRIFALDNQRIGNERRGGMSSNSKRVTTTTTDRPRETGPWDSALAQLQKWDPEWAKTCLTMTTNPWTGGVLSRKFVELIGVTINASCTNLNPEGTRRHIRAALHEGATRDEILMVLKMASILAIHSCALGGPILLEEASEASLDAAGVGRAKRLKKAGEKTPAIDKMLGFERDLWDYATFLT